MRIAGAQRLLAGTIQQELDLVPMLKDVAADLSSSLNRFLLNVRVDFHEFRMRFQQSL
jgi:hypothetical protein